MRFATEIVGVRRAGKKEKRNWIVLCDANARRIGDHDLYAVVPIHHLYTEQQDVE